MRVNLIRLGRPVSVSDPHGGFSLGPLRPPRGFEQAEESHRGPGDPEGAY